MTKAQLSLAVRKAIGFTVASVLMAAIANATTLDNKIASGAYKIITGDFDGDQKADVLYQGRRENEHELKLSADVSVQRWKDGFLGLDWNFASVNLIVGDFNGDAAGDVILQSQSPGLMTQVMHAEYNGNFGNPVQAIGDYHQGFRWDDKHHRLIVGDFNGDMKDDIFLQGTHNKYRHGIALASNKGTFDTIAYDFDNAHLNIDWSSQANNIFAGDFDGNGQSELLFQPINMGYVSLVRSEKAFIDTLAQSYPNDHLGLSWLPKDHRVLIGDFNGDSKDDVFLLTTDNQQKSALIPSEGKGFSAITQEIAQIPNLDNLKDVLVADFDADSIDDIVLMYNDGSLAALMAEGKRLAAIEAALKKLALLNIKSRLNPIKSTAVVNTSLASSAAKLGPVNECNQPQVQQGGETLAFGDPCEPWEPPVEPPTPPPSSTPSVLRPVNAVGFLAGQSGVSGGTATYEIPLSIPPGRAGVQPSLSLNYNSRAGNGALGMGWELNLGNAKISRCPSTVAQDNTVRAIALDNGDKLCLDGSRLMLVEGVYGKSGSRYRTEIESYLTVTLFGDISSASSYFELKKGSGDLQVFSVSEIPLGASVPLAWHQRSLQTPSGNNINFSYLTGAFGEKLISEVFYTGTGAANGDRKIQIEYETRNDIDSSYVKGARIATNLRVNRIKTLVNTTSLVNEYSIGYKYSQNSGRSLVEWIQQCSHLDGSPKCLVEVRPSWADEKPSFEFPKFLGGINLPAGVTHANSGHKGNEVSLNTLPDTNGDGRAELRIGARLIETGNRQYRSFLASSKYDTSLEFLKEQTLGGFDDVKTNALDIDSDGRLDQLFPFDSIGNVGVASWNVDLQKFNNNKSLNIRADIVKIFGAYFTDNGEVNQNVEQLAPWDMVACLPFIYDKCLRAVDVNGDGWHDIISQRFIGDNLSDAIPRDHRVYAYLNQPKAGSSTEREFGVGVELYDTLDTSTYHATNNIEPKRYYIKRTAEILSEVKDVDGNGFPDLILDPPGGNNKSVVFMYPNMQMSAKTSFSALGITENLEGYHLFADVNGDGLDDFIFIKLVNSTPFWHIRLNKGGTFGSALNTGINEGTQACEANKCADYGYSPKFGALISVVDWNNDGKMELIVPNGTYNNSTFCSEYKFGPPGEPLSRYFSSIPVSGCGPSSTPNYYEKGNKGQDDFAAYKWIVIQFSETITGISGSVIDTNMVGFINLYLADFNGDGKNDIFTNAHTNENINESGQLTTWHIPQLTALGFNGPGLGYGTYVAKNTSQSTDELLNIGYGSMVKVKWSYAPLSAGDVVRSSVGNIPFYKVKKSNSERVLDSQHIYFASSMRAVQSYEVENGVGSFVKTEFAYEDAIFNKAGRGFSGFRKIHEIASKGLMTSREYHYAFPLTGSVLNEEIISLSNNVKIRTTANLWRFNGPSQTFYGAPYANGPYDNKTYLPWLESSSGESRDLNNSSTGTEALSQSAPTSSCGLSATTTTTKSDVYQTQVSRSVKDLAACSREWPHWDSETVTKTSTPTGGSADTKVTKTTVNSWSTTLRKPTKVTTGHSSDSKLQLVTETGYDGFGNANNVITYVASDATVKRITSSDWGTSGYFVESITDAVGQVVTMTYEPAYGQVRTVKDPFHNIVETRYDEFGRAKWQQQQGQVSTGTAATTTFEWVTAAEKLAMPNSVYKVIKTQVGVQPTQTTWFDSINRPLRTQSQDPIVSTKYINQDTVYDRFGRTTEQSIPYFSTSTPSACQKTLFGGFDVLDRPAWKKLPNDNGCQLTVAYTYNGLSTDVQVGPNALYKVQRVKNALGQWWQTTDQGSEGATGSAAVTTSFRYDANGNPISITRNGVANTAVYNDIGQKTAMTDPERGTWLFEYNIWGELTKQTDGKNQITAFSYDNIGRPLKRKESPNTTTTPSDVVTWTYNPVTGKTAKPLYSAVKSDTTGSVTKTFGYNAEGLVSSTNITLAPTSETSRSFSLSQSYDGEDRPDISSLPNARGSIKAKYNTQGFATHSEATVNGAMVIPYQTLMTDAFGNSTSARFGNGLHSSQTFSANTGRITGLCVNANSSCTPNTPGNVQGISYGEGTPWYDSYGNLTQQKNIVQNVTETFSYDPRMRLTQSHRVAVLGGGLSDFTQTNSYQYDALGNLLEKSDYAKVIEYTKANKPHQAHKAWADAAKTQLLAEYNYDANGNLTSSTGQAAQTRTSVYNHQMVPTSITRGTASALFAYDESNERYFEKHVSNGKTEKIYKLGKAFELKFTTEAGTTTEEEQHYLGSQVQLMYKKAQNGKAECYQWRYLHTDRLGSVETITNQSKAVIERHGFDPFGKPRAANWMMDSTRDGTTNTEKGLYSRVTTRGYTGHDHIDSVGVIHMNGRSYDPELGRFMGVDPFMQAPLNSQSLNPYSYVMNNPLAGTDPTGYFNICKTNIFCESVEVNPSTKLDKSSKMEAPIVITVQTNKPVSTEKIGDISTADVDKVEFSQNGKLVATIVISGGTVGADTPASNQKNDGINFIGGMVQAVADTISDGANDVIRSIEAAASEIDSARGLPSSSTPSLAAPPSTYNGPNDEDSLAGYEAGKEVAPILLGLAAMRNPLGKVSQAEALTPLTYGKNARGHLVKHADVLGFEGVTPQELQKMAPQLKNALEKLYSQSNPALTRVGAYGQTQNARMYISNGKMIVTKADGEFVTVVSNAGRWYNKATPLN